MSLLRYIVGGNDILGMNARNFTYVSRGVGKKTRQSIDQKLLTKRTLRRAGLPVVHTYGIISSFHKLNDFDWGSLPKSFVVKPNLGLGGRGIMVVFGKKKGSDSTWIKADKERIDIDDLRTHIGNIIEGNYSLGSQPDKAFFEERVKIHPDLKPYAYRGVPDVRIIVYNSVPVMAMLRLPTRKSQGKANLEQGAVGTGIDMATGKTTFAITGKGKITDTIPNSRVKISGIQIPDWHNVLKLAVQAQQVFGIKYTGVDIAIDKDEGPKILELNVRPGLSIQIANLAPLRVRLDQVKNKKVKDVQQAINIAQNLFSEDRDPEKHSGRTLIGIVEPVKIHYGKKGAKTYAAMAKMDTGAMSSSIDEELARKLGFNLKAAKKKIVRNALGRERRSYITLNFTLRDEKIKTVVGVADRSNMAYKLIIGRRDLSKFLVDPSLKKKKGV